MKRLVHLSDLHFGKDDPDLLEPLISAVNGLSPDLIAISGDLTQRARGGQFRAAREFIDRLAAPVLCVPGNHDVPLHNLLARLLWPWVTYRRWIGMWLEPEHRDPEMVVLGVNTVNNLSHQRGLFTARALRRIERGFADAPGDAVRVVVAHHPLEHRPEDRKKLMRGAAEAVEALSRMRADVILSGHLHSWRAAPFARKVGREAVLQVHAGTGLSTRLRGEENNFNLLEISTGEIAVTRFSTGGAERGYRPAQTCHFAEGDGGWAPRQGA